MFKTFLWSDYFERTLVWSEAISSALQCDQRRFRAHSSLIRGDFERTSVLSEAILSTLQSDQRRILAHTRLIRGDIRAHNSLIRGSLRAHSKRTRSLERTLVWAEFKPVWLGLIRGQFCLEWSDQRSFRSGPQPGMSLKYNSGLSETSDEEPIWPNKKTIGLLKKTIRVRSNMLQFFIEVIQDN